MIFLSISLLFCLPALAQPDPDPRAEVFSAEFDYTSKYLTINGHSLHYIDEGSTQRRYVPVPAWQPYFFLSLAQCDALCETSSPHRGRGQH